MRSPALNRVSPARNRPASGVRNPPGRRHGAAWGVLLTVLLLASMTFAVTLGPAQLTGQEVWGAVAHHLGLGTSPLSPLRDGIVWELRLPRVLTAAAVGAGLAVSGAVMQALTRNPLADPYLLGLSSGASLGAVAVLLLGLAVFRLIALVMTGLPLLKELKHQ